MTAVAAISISSPIIAEVDGELDSPEIFIRADYNIFGLNCDGSFIDGFPYPINDDNMTATHSPSPAIDDIDGNGSADMIFGTPSGRIYLVDWPGTLDVERTDWPMFKHDRYGTGLFDFEIPADIQEVDAIPGLFELFQNYPNPFNATTNISFVLSVPNRVSLIIYDLLGRQALSSTNEELPAGKHSIEFNAADLASGLYIYKLTAEINIAQSG